MTGQDNSSSRVKFKRQITKEHLERGSLRILARRHGYSRNTLNNFVHEITKNVKNSHYIATHLKPKWSGTLVVDGKVVKVFDHFTKNIKNLSEGEYRASHRKVWLCGIDYGTGDLPHYSIADSENKIDLVMYFKQLKKNGYILLNLVSDGNPLINVSAKFVYGDSFVFQLCTRHFLEDMRRKMVQEEKHFVTYKKLLVPNAIKHPIPNKKVIH